MNSNCMDTYEKTYIFVESNKDVTKHPQFTKSSVVPNSIWYGEPYTIEGITYRDWELETPDFKFIGEELLTSKLELN